MKQDHDSKQDVTDPHPLGPPWLRPPETTHALQSSIWPASAHRSLDGSLQLGGVNSLELASRFGTPLYLVDEAYFRERAARILHAAQSACKHGVKADVYYASKAFLCTAVTKWVLEAGMHIDVCSGGELAVVLAAGADPSRIGFHGNNKSQTEIDEAVRVGVGAIVLDNPAEVPLIARAAAQYERTQGVRLRVNSGVHASTHDFLATAREDQKFGIPIADTPGVVAQIRQQTSLRFLGLHAHIGSQIFGAAAFRESARRLLSLQAKLLQEGPVPQLNLGGGFGIAYTAMDSPEPIEKLISEIVDAVADCCAELDIPLPHLAFEPGRWIAGPAGITLYEVGAIKDVLVGLKNGTQSIRKYVSVDGGMSDNTRPALYGAQYCSCIANRSSKAQPNLVRVVGKHCESGDIVIDADYLPADVAAGDLLAVACTGAYCHSLSSNYNMVPRPAVVAVRDGVAKVIIRRETMKDLLSRDPGVGL